jgi:hypothetical protein
MVDDSREDKNSILRPSVFVAYIVFVSFMHEYAFWGKFHIQLLEHIGLADLPKLAVWPLLATASLILFVSAITTITLVTDKPPTPSTVLPAIKFAVVHSKLVGSLLLICGVALFFVDKGARFWVIDATLLALGISVLLDFSRLFWIYKIPWRAEFTYAVILVPCLAFCAGNHRAAALLDGSEYDEAQFSSSDSDSLRYLGRAGDYVFFWNPSTSRTELRRLESIQPLMLRHVDTTWTGAVGGATSQKCN